MRALEAPVSPVGRVAGSTWMPWPLLEVGVDGDEEVDGEDGVDETGTVDEDTAGVVDCVGRGGGALVARQDVAARLIAITPVRVRSGRAEAMATRRDSMDRSSDLCGQDLSVGPGDRTR